MPSFILLRQQAAYWRRRRRVHFARDAIRGKATRFESRSFGLLDHGTWPHASQHAWSMPLFLHASRPQCPFLAIERSRDSPPAHSLAHPILALFVTPSHSAVHISHSGSVPSSPRASRADEFIVRLFNALECAGFSAAADVNFCLDPVGFPLVALCLRRSRCFLAA